MFSFKPTQVKVLLSVLVLVALAAKTGAQPGKALEAVHTLKWLPDVTYKVTENEIIKSLNFEGALFDGTKNSLPYFVERLPNPFPGMDVQFALRDAVYEPFNTQVPVDRSQLGPEARVHAEIVYERKVGQLAINILPLRINPATQGLERLISFNYQILPGVPLRTASAQRVFASHSVLSTGEWYKIGVTKTGIHIINADLLRQLGLNPSAVNPAQLRLFGNGGGALPYLNSKYRHDDLAENAIFVNDGGTPGVFDENDFVLFYGTAQVGWRYDSTDNRYHHNQNFYCDFTYYFLTPYLNTGSAPRRLGAQPSSTLTPTHVVNQFDDFRYHEVDNLNFIKSGRQWYGEQFDTDLSQDFDFSFPNMVLSEPVYVKSSVIAHSFSPSFFKLNYNNQQLLQHNVPAVGSSYTSDYADESILNTTFTATSGNIRLNLVYIPTTSTSVGYLDYFELNVRRNLVMNGGQMMFRDSRSAGPGQVAQFNLQAGAGTQVWNVTDPVSPRFQQFGTGTTFAVASDSIQEFVAFDGTSYLTPFTVGVVPNQDLHGMSQKDMIIMVPPVFLSEALRLADFHQSHDNLRVAVVTPEQVFNEFASGAQDIIGVRDFLKMFYDRAAVPADIPRYLLLFGDGSYDNKSTAASNTNFLPTYQSLNSISLVRSYVSDDFYGFLDDNEGDWDDAVTDLIDIGIGRFPVKTIAEAQIVVNKTIDYLTPGTFTDGTNCSAGNTSSLGDWRNTVCFIADDEDAALHLDQSNGHANYMANNYPQYNVDKIYIDAYRQLSTPGGQRYPEVNEAISRRVEKGALVINYTGHGGETGWAGERILDNTMVQSWQNIRKLPLFITATCEFSRYDDPGRTSTGELVLINSEAGGIALMTTTRLVYAFQNSVLNTAMIAHLFDITGQIPRLGEIYMDVKNDNNVLTIAGQNSRNFSLLGDPALLMAYPKYDVVATTINGNPLVANVDTLGALTKVTLGGEIRQNGTKLTSFNGIIYPTVYDKKVDVTTLSNDANSPLRTFSLQKNILYKGKASVVNGEFSFTFIVPKDISYQIGNGRLSFYAQNGAEDASGYYDSLLIGGSSNSPITDNIGPGIKLYMNDEKFAFGGTTDENPKIYALVTDTNGINTVGNGIGHDITAIIDGNTENVYVLNDYYEADLDKYQSGKILYPLTDIPSGRHTLQFKVWDIFNNSSEAYTEFVVAESANLALNHVLNYPNPFTTHTSFFFEHNRPCNTLDVMVQVFTVSGKLIKTLSKTVTCEGYRVDDLDWDGRDDFGDRIGKGVYVYRLKIRDSDGATAEKYEKLVVLK